MIIASVAGGFGGQPMVGVDIVPFTDEAAVWSRLAVERIAKHAPMARENPH